MIVSGCLAGQSAADLDIPESLKRCSSDPECYLMDYGCFKQTAINSTSFDRVQQIINDANLNPAILNCARIRPAPPIIYEPACENGVCIIKEHDICQKPDCTPETPYCAVVKLRVWDTARPEEQAEIHEPVFGPSESICRSKCDLTHTQNLFREQQFLDTYPNGRITVDCLFNDQRVHIETLGQSSSERSANASRRADKSQQPDEGQQGCDMTIINGSYGGGIDRAVFNAIMEAVLSSDDVASHVSENVGIEGDTRVCITLKNDSQPDKFYQSIKRLIPAESRKGWTRLEMPGKEPFTTVWPKN